LEFFSKELQNNQKGVAMVLEFRNQSYRCQYNMQSTYQMHEQPEN